MNHPIISNAEPVGLLVNESTPKTWLLTSYNAHNIDDKLDEQVIGLAKDIRAYKPLTKIGAELLRLDLTHNPCIELVNESVSAYFLGSNEERIEFGSAHLIPENTAICLSFDVIYKVPPLLIRLTPADAIKHDFFEILDPKAVKRNKEVSEFLERFFEKDHETMKINEQLSPLVQNHKNDKDLLLALYDILGFVYHLAALTVPDRAPELADTSRDELIEILNELISEFPSDNADDKLILRKLVTKVEQRIAKSGRDSFEAIYQEIEVTKKQIAGRVKVSNLSPGARKALNRMKSLE